MAYLFYDDKSKFELGGETAKGAVLMNREINQDKLLFTVPFLKATVSKSISLNTSKTPVHVEIPIDSSFTLNGYDGWLPIGVIGYNCLTSNSGAIPVAVSEARIWMPSSSYQVDAFVTFVGNDSFVGYDNVVFSVDVLYVPTYTVKANAAL